MIALALQSAQPERRNDFLLLHPLTQPLEISETSGKSALPLEPRLKGISQSSSEKEGAKTLVSDTLEDRLYENSAGVKKAFSDYARPPAAIPTLGLNHDGSLLAAWIKADHKITVSFLPNDQAKAILILPTTRGEKEVLSWQGNVASLRDFIARNHALLCLE